MYKEEKIINGILHYRTHPNAEFKPYTLENLTGIVGMLKEEMQKQEQGNIEGKDTITIEGKDPINIEGKDPITIDCASMIYNPKEWEATLGVDSSRINFGYESMQVKMYTEEEVKNIMAETWIRCVGNDGNDFKELRDKILEQFENK